MKAKSKVDPTGEIRDRIQAAKCFSCPPDDLSEVETPNLATLIDARNKARNMAAYLDELIADWDKDE